MRSRPNKRNKELWCHYHNDHGHTTDNCGSLKRAIEALIKQGQLRKFIAHKDGRQQTPPEVDEREDREEHTGIISTISGGLAAGGSSRKSRKAYAREVCITSQNPSKKQKTASVPAISFSYEDLKYVKTPHDDPLVVTIKAGNFEVKRVLVDNGSSVEILFYDAFKKMNIPMDRLRKMDSPLYGFSNYSVAVEGIIALPVAIRTPPTQANLMFDFVVVKVPTAQRHIGTTGTQPVVGCGVNLPPQNEISYRKRDRRGERRPDNSPSVLRDFMPIEEQRSTHYRRSPRRYKDVKGEPVENLVSIEVYPGDEDKTVRIGSNLKEDIKLELTSFDELKTYLTSPPLLSKPFPGEDLFLYLSVTEVTVSAVLVREGDEVQKPIYYVSKVLQDVETRYPKIDRIALALITSARRLRPYF
ncbi:hypothetical protein RJ639_001166 [Escallonia herrerae]|uniref:Reverse transcriptase/retrotransposon-derived protein RNase H-like domain-containing protein n=1 Tax=Escallonia herrerae TaxID=1293975 RepID=A0AA88XHL6_9ASTE|nr:hypothetical protein RJ639_001166 [Escallonia herrerae]